ncbi:MAG: S49 family peptidase, partial [Victivallales bacterium]|nr:S49 family peptidase [Victivallales bacterium]
MEENNTFSGGNAQERPPMAYIADTGVRSESPRPAAPPRRPNPPQIAPLRFFAGYSMGCLTAALMIFAVLALCVGSCTYLLSMDLPSATSTSGSGEVLVTGSGDMKIAVISINGIISRESSSNGWTVMPSSTDIAGQILRAAEDPAVCAIILDMDTPGGEVVASDEIRSAVDHAISRWQMPVVTCMHAMAASGGYYIASGSSWIIANRMTFTGSIGVIMQSLQYSGLMDKLGVSTAVYKSGDMKD